MKQGAVKAVAPLEVEQSIWRLTGNLLDLLAAERGRWSCTDAGEVQMDSSEAAAQFERIASELASLGEQRVALYRDELKSQLELWGGSPDGGESTGVEKR